MEITTSRFGTIAVQASDTICFPDGLAGFEDCHSWLLLMERPRRTVGWLQSTQWPELALPVIDPRKFVPDYALELAASEWLPLGVADRDRIQVLVTVAKHDSVLTLNLRAPLAINRRRRLGRQVINSDHWPVDHFVMDAASVLRRIA